MRRLNTVSSASSAVAALLLLAGCVTTVSLDVGLPDLEDPPNPILPDCGRLSGAFPDDVDRCHNAFVELAQSGKGREAVELYQHMRCRWPDARSNPYLASAGHLAGRSAFFLARPPPEAATPGDSYLDWYGHYIDCLAAAERLFAFSVEADRSASAEMAALAGLYLEVISKGYLEPVAVCLYAQAEREVVVEYIETDDLLHLERAEAYLGRILAGHPSWARRFDVRRRKEIVELLIREEQESER